MSDKALPMTAANRQKSLKGIKTQTRRIIKLLDGPDGWEFTGWLSNNTLQFDCGRVFHQIKPRYRVGDRCWITEKWATGFYGDDIKPSELVKEAIILYADSPSWNSIFRGRIRQSRFMCKWMSQGWVKITRILNPHRVQDISEKDAIAEGYDPFISGYDDNALDSLMTSAMMPELWTPCRAYFARGWETIHGHGAWERNDWVLPIEFEIIESPQGSEDETIR